MAPYIKNPGTLGIDATFRLVDAVQYRARVRRFRFRHDHAALQPSATPGDSMRPFFSRRRRRPRAPTISQASPIRRIDALIEKIIGGRIAARS